MRTLRVDVPGGSYPILIGAGAVGRLASWMRREGVPSSILVVTDSRVARLYRRKLEVELERLKVPVHLVSVPAGEASKSTARLEHIWRRAIRLGVDRRSCLIALGGGVVGDLGGMAAATILRGISLVQVPTTLLAMVDSSVGGKTGINLPEGKNLVGAFHQPDAVFIDTDFLASLPRRERSAGWAEIIKSAAIRDSKLFSLLEREAKKLGADAGGGLERVVRATCRIKADVVNQDEREAGLRMILNFGHTFGHGLETAIGYGGLLHGEAVAIGMHFASRFACALGLADPGVERRIGDVIDRFDLPLQVPSRYAVSADAVLRAMARDKKKGPRGLRWVFVPRIGRTEIHDDIPAEAVRSAVRGFLKGA